MRIVLDFENQGYVLDKPLPTALPEASSPEERVTFDKLFEDNCKVRSIIVTSMTNEIQKQYDRLEEVPSIMLHMQEVYAVPDRHIRYAAIKAFFGTKMAEGEASTSKVKGKRAECWMRKKGKGKAVTTTASAEGAPAAPKGKGKGKVGVKLDYDCPTQMKLDNHENAQLWHARLGHISKNRIRRLVDSSLEIEDLDHLPTCESCLKGKMTKKPFVGQSALANGLLNLIHTDICGPLNTPARGRYSYFITFTDDPSRYGYVYLMRYKSEAFERFKEYRLEVENQTGRKIKAIRSD
ncbi:UNVERIFIED_CONTAM: hypothetical protein Slati_0162900 [Sesamum latifolium]|uniref:GAG-pre-integrase domain-containing protein n=1 Tax=Sesamum latifolium TaxID=2727402 RepID=A0AAW2YAI2_9LAMI